MARKKVTKFFPKSEPVSTAHKTLVKSMRAKIFDVGMVRGAVFRPKPGSFFFGMDELWNTMRRLGILTKPGVHTCLLTTLILDLDVALQGR